MKKIILILLLIISLSANDRITICGTGDSQELLSALALAYEKDNLNSKIAIEDSIGSGGGIKSVVFDQCDLGRVARGIKKSEEKYNLNYIEFAKSAVVFVTNPNIDKINNITTKEVVSIFDGTTKRWENIDEHSEGKIYIARREAGDSSTTVIEKNIDNYKNIKELAGKVIFTTPKTVNIICKYKNTIGYLPLSQAINKKLNILSLDGIEASVENIMQDKYKLVVPFGLVYKGKLSKLSKNFIDFIFSEDGKKIILSHGSIPSFRLSR